MGAGLLCPAREGEPRFSGKGNSDRRCPKLTHALPLALCPSIAVAGQNLVHTGLQSGQSLHRSAGEFAPVFEDVRNTHINDHVADEPNESPQCSDCHGEGHLHDAALEKPEPTIAFCKGCHQHEDHNRGRDCLSCHIDVHGVVEEPEGPDWLHAPW